MRAFAHLVTVGVDEVNDTVQVPDIPSTAVLVHKFGKRTKAAESNQMLTLGCVISV